MSKKYKAAIFDLDGTLLDTVEDLADSANAALRRLNLPQRSLGEIRLMVGNGFNMLIKRALPEDRCEDMELFDKALELFSEEYSDRYMNKTVPYEGIMDLIETLKKGRVLMAVNSNKRESYTIDLINKIFGPDTFRIVLGDDMKRPRKPAPDSVDEILSALGTSREETLFIGDTGVDVATAKNSGLDFLGVSWGFRGVKELLDNGAEDIAETAGDIADYFS